MRVKDNFKPWPNGLKSTQVLDSCSTCVSFGHPLAWTCIDLRWLWSSSNLDASRRKFLPFGHPAQVDTSWSQVICCYKNALTNDMHEIYGFCDLRFVNLRRLASPFGQSFRRRLNCEAFCSVFSFWSIDRWHSLACAHPSGVSGGCAQTNTAATHLKQNNHEIRGLWPDKANWTARITIFIYTKLTI